MKKTGITLVCEAYVFEKKDVVTQRVKESSALLSYNEKWLREYLKRALRVKNIYMSVYEDHFWLCNISP